jgi:predicted PurR-regulated permease PerM
MEELPLGTSDSRSAADRVDTRSVTVTTFATVCAVVALREGVSLMAPLLVSVLLAYALEPIVVLLMRCRLPRTIAILTVYGVLIAGFVATGRLAQQQVSGFVAALPATVRDLQRSIERARRSDRPRSPSPIAQLQHAATDLKATLDPLGPEPVPGIKRVETVAPPFTLTAYLANASVVVAATGARLIAIAILTFLLLITGETLKRKLIAIAGPRAQKKVTHDVIKAIDRQIARYLVARMLISAIVAAATWLGLWALGVRQPLVLGGIAGMLNIVPFIGPAAAVALVAVVTFVQFHTIGMTAAAAGVAGAIAAIEGNAISPWLTGRAGELNLVAVFVSVLFWGWMWDVWGLLLAIPITVAIKAAADHIEPLQPFGELLGR